MRETAVRFGDGEYMVGVLATADAEPERSRPDFVFLNSGLLLTALSLMQA